MTTSEQARLYNPAAARDGAPTPLLHVDSGCSFFSGESGSLEAHKSGSPVYIAALYGGFRLRMGGGDWIDCRAAIVPAGAWRSLDFHGEPFAAIHVEPTIGRLPALSSLLRDSREVDGAVIGVSTELATLRELYEGSGSENWVGDALNELLRCSARRSSAAELAAPLRNVVELLHQRHADQTPVEHYARIAGLSSSRFQHLFTRQVGVPFRRYRAWSRLRFACHRIGEGQSVTAAAHESGFFDSAHFAHEFRRAFGKKFDKSCRHIQRLGRVPADGKIDPR